MPRKRRPAPGDFEPPQAELEFDRVIGAAQVLSRDQVLAAGELYDPVEVTANYAERAIRLEEAWPTTIARARELLLTVEPRQLYFDFLSDLADRVASGGATTERLAALLEQVAVRGLGMTSRELSVRRPTTGGTHWRVNFDSDAIRAHLETHIIGDCFLNPISVGEITEGSDALIGASDVSQHASAVPVPARFFKRTVPFVLNNAAGALFETENGRPKYHNIFNPKPDEALLRWMLIDPSYQDDLEQEDYRRCLASAMDVGQYRFDLEYLMKGDRRPDIILRDGSLFPQDAYLDNFVVDNRRGEFTREAIRELLDCLLYAQTLGVVYCGVAKNIQLKVYSAVVDWFISVHIDKNWQFGSYVLNDGQAMSVLLATPAFREQNLGTTVSTCLIRRSFTTRANLNTRADLGDLDEYFRDAERRLAGQRTRIDITPYRRLCELAQIYMLFVGHSQSPTEQLPRYEFFAPNAEPGPEVQARRILGALQRCGFTIDSDHSFMAKDLVRYLIPAVTQQAHTISKDVGRHIDSVTGQWIMSRFRRNLRDGG
jgi:hypothetical protein